jgi:hypothetical protein
MALLVGALPVFFGPVLENALSTAAPTRVDSDLTDHVIVCSCTIRFTPTPARQEVMGKICANVEI